MDLQERGRVVFVVTNHQMQERGPTILEPQANKSQNQSVDAFIDGGNYVFREAMDNYALDVYHADKTEGTLVRITGANGSNAQSWKAFLDDSSDQPMGYKLQSAIDSSYALTMLNKFQNHKVVLMPFNGLREQYWHLMKIHGTDKYFILNSSNGKAVTSFGSEVNLRACEPDINDLHQQWGITMTMS